VKQKAKADSKTVVGTSLGNTRLRSVQTVRTVDVFVSRLHPATVDEDLLHCVDVMKDKVNIFDVTCTILKSKYEALYTSYYVAIKVNSAVLSGKCSKKVKVRLFRSYCLRMYGTALWNTDTVNCMKKLRSCYHRCIKSFFGFDRLYDVTAILLEQQLPRFDNILHNYKFSYNMQITCSSNAVLKYLVSIGM